MEAYTPRLKNMNDQDLERSTIPSALPVPEHHITSRLKRHFSTEVSTNHADVLLLTCCLISGFVDSTIYNAYGTFVSMQTVISNSLHLLSS